VTSPQREEPALVLDCLGWKCPRPIIELARRLGDVGVGGLIELVADDPAAEPDVSAWCRMRVQELVEARPPHFLIRRLS
jgi:tRNA 2-thiouridine synthesizing protein A